MKKRHEPAHDARRLATWAALLTALAVAAIGGVFGVSHLGSEAALPLATSSAQHAPASSAQHAPRTESAAGDARTTSERGHGDRASRDEARPRAQGPRAPRRGGSSAEGSGERGGRSAEEGAIANVDAGVPSLTRSPQSTVSVQMTIENTCSVPVHVVWIDFEGREWPYGSVPSGQVRTRPSFEGNVWHVRDSESGTTLRVFAAGQNTYVEACDRGSALYGPAESPPPPRDLPTTCSRGTNEATRLRVRNACDEPIELLWVEFDCALRSYARIEPGGEAVQRTFVGHVWRAQDTRGALLVETTAQADEQPLIVACPPRR